MKIFCALFLLSVITLSCGPTHISSYRFQPPEYLVKNDQNILQVAGHDTINVAKIENEPELLVANKKDAIAPATSSHKFSEPSELPVETELTKEEKKVMKKELRKKVKEFKKAIKTGDTVKAEAAAQEIDYYLKMGIVIGGAGLILMIIGSLTTGVITAIGAIALVAGLVLIILYVANT